MSKSEKELLEALKDAGYRVVADSGWMNVPDSGCRCQKCETIVRLKTDLRMLRQLIREKVDLATLTREESELVNDQGDIAMVRVYEQD